jgi:hypothetical protein
MTEEVTESEVGVLLGSGNERRGDLEGAVGFVYFFAGKEPARL